jgi:hypothetical protein
VSENQVYFRDPRTPSLPSSPHNAGAVEPGSEGVAVVMATPIPSILFPPVAANGTVVVVQAPPPPPRPLPTIVPSVAKLPAYYETYKVLVAMALSDHLLPPDEEKFLQSYRIKHGIDDDTHTRVLIELGVSADDYKRIRNTVALIPTPCVICLDQQVSRPTYFSNRHWKC